MLKLQACTVDLDTHQVTRAHQTVALSTIEARLLAYLVAHAGEVVDQQRLLRDVWRYSDQVVSRTVRTTVGRLRRKIERDPRAPLHLQTIYGEGYRFVLREPEIRPGATNLPASVDSFVGRPAEQAAALASLQSPRRLLTLVGPGGVGKTRLAQQLGATLVSAGRTVWFCDCSPARSADAIHQVVARVLGMPLSTSSTARGLLQSMRAQGPVVFILDNVEQVVEDAAAVCSGWVAGLPEASFLVTSREALRIHAETVQQVAPLGTEDACALLADRARSRGVERMLDEAHARAIAGALDGLPLALELAAGRLDELGPEALLAGLQDRLRLLRSTLRDAAPRHASAEAAVDWSWQLLDPTARSVLGACAQFEGSATASGVAVVCELPVAQVTEALAGLARRSLVREGAGAGRFVMLQTVRAFVREQVRDRHDELARRHLVWAVTRAREADTRALHPDLDDLVVALRLAVASEPEAAAELGCALDPLLAGLGPRALHIEVLELAAAAAPPDSTPALVAALGAALAHAGQTRAACERLDPLLAREDLTPEVAGRAHLARAHALQHVRFALSASDAEAALELGRLVDDPLLAGKAHRLLAEIARADNRPADAAVQLEAAIPLLTRATDRSELALAHLDRARLHRTMRVFEEAHAELERARTLFEDAADALGTIQVRVQLGALLSVEGAHREAKAVFEDTLPDARRMGDTRRVWHLLLRLAEAAAELRQTEDAEAALVEAMAISTEDGDARGVANLQMVQGSLLVDGGHTDRGLAALEAALETLRTQQEVHNVATGTYFLGVARAYTGDLEGAAPLLAEGIEANRRQSLAAHAAYGRLWAAAVASERGRVDEAKALLAEARTFDLASVVELDDMARLMDAHVAIARAESPEARVDAARFARRRMARHADARVTRDLRWFMATLVRALDARGL